MNRGMRNGRGQGLGRRDGSCRTQQNKKGFGRGQGRCRGLCMDNTPPFAQDAQSAEPRLTGRFNRRRQNSDRA